MIALFVACTSSTDPAPSGASTPSTAAVPNGDPTGSPRQPAFPAEAPEAPAVGVGEVSTPAGIARLESATADVPNRRLEFTVDFDHADFASAHEALVRWGFTIDDADGAVLRAVAPPGDAWSERLEPLPGFARVAETLSQDRMADGRLRAGSARFDGGITHTWGIEEGGLKEKLDGARLPPEAQLPRGLPVAVVRCLAPLRMALVDGESQGPGWERALDTNSGVWALVLEHFGACDATGWLPAKADAKVESLTIAGKPLKTVNEELLFTAATAYLSTPRSRSDESAIAAADILRRAPDERLATAIGAIAAGTHQERLLLALAERIEPAALAVAAAHPTPTTLAWAAGVDEKTRAAVMADPNAAADALLIAMSAWKPLSDDDPAALRLESHPDPRVRMRAWELAIEAGTSECMARLPSAKAATLTEAEALYTECPQQPVRLQAFSRVAQLDKAEAARLVAGTLARPETVRTGIGAVRAANSLERDDLLEAAVADGGADRDVRAEALRTLLRVGRSANAGSLAARHGAFLGVKVPAINVGNAERGDGVVSAPAKAPAPAGSGTRAPSATPPGGPAGAANDRAKPDGRP